MDDIMDIALSSRIRLARNIEKYKFRNYMNAQEKRELINEVTVALSGGDEFLLTLMDDMPARERKLLVERHLISMNLAESEHTAALISKDETVSILIGEEDHIRIQCLRPGLALTEADAISIAVDDKLCEKLDYAFSEEFGYLTACPTNIGSGLRASVMLHLPALSLTGQQNALLSTISKLGYAVRGIYGEGSEAAGHIYQVSNQMTLGILEEDIINNLQTTIMRIVDQERRISALLYKNNKLELEDIVFRSCGLLRYARKLTLAEAMEHISNLKLGSGVGIISEQKPGLFNRLLTDIQSAAIEKRAGLEFNDLQRDEARASMLREALNNECGL